MLFLIINFDFFKMYLMYDGFFLINKEVVFFIANNFWLNNINNKFTSKSYDTVKYFDNKKLFHNEKIIQNLIIL